MKASLVARFVVLFIVLFTGLIGVCGVIVAGGQTADAQLQTRVERLFPEAVRFSEKTGNPPHFEAYGHNPNGGGEPILAGFAFYTTDLEPLERAYDGPIQVLVGMDLNGMLTGVIVVDHNEPYGYFSVDEPEFAAQFARKSIRAGFKVGEDVDAVSRATISIRSATRAIRNSSRRIARRFLDPEDVK